MRRHRSDHHARQLFAGAGTIAGIALAATLILAAAGFPPLEDPGVPAAEVTGPQATTVNWSQTPANDLLTAALQSPPGNWKANGELQRAVIAPRPYSCPVQNSAASVSVARSFTVDGKALRVTLQAYTAGLGAEALAQMYQSAGICGGAEGAAAISPIYGDSPGTDGKIASVSHVGQRTSVASFRLGDVVAFISGSDSQTLINAAVSLGTALESSLGGACADTGSPAGDAARNPFSLAGYKTHTQAASVSIPAVELPASSPSPSASPSASVSPSGPAGQGTYPIPSPELVKTVARPMDQPAFPVWPDMPAPVTLPEAPKPPASAATTKKSFQVPAEDTAGPGCGWAFTGLKAPGFDQAMAEASKAKQSTDAMAALKAGAKTWQDDVLTYWKAYTEYSKQAEAYNKYAAGVEETNRAWEATAAKWDEHAEAMKAYEAKKTAREEFLSRQDNARTEYEEQSRKCLAPLPAPAAEDLPAEPAPGTETPASPSPSPSPSVLPVPAQRPGCPAVKPPILAEKAPDTPTAPKEPANPRP